MIPPSHLAERIAAQIAPLIPAHSSILIGLSGGVDSVVLLHLLHHLAARFPWRLSALHVHHGISPRATDWEDFCADLCASLQIPLHIEHVDIAPLRGHGIEAAARKLRHAVFAAQVCDFIALAHHADDQAETLLLQLLRGSGVRGAAAMPMLAERAGSHGVLRPLLHCSRREILAYAQQQGLQWIEDESNADDSYPRNFLRHRVLPLLEQKFPAYRGTLVRSTRHFAEASELLDELARQDAGQALEGNTMQVAALRKLSLIRAKNLLRYFLHARGAPLPRSAQLEEMLRQLCDARQDAAVSVRFGDHQVRRFRDRVYVLPLVAEFDHGFVLPWQGETALDWPPLAGCLRFSRSTGVGVSLRKLQHAPLTLRLRNGSETLRPHPAAERRTLKKLLQQHHIPPWQRERLPLLFCGEELVCVVGVAIDAEYQALNNEDGVLVSCE
ncbi:MAG: tRNA lysidine(34) synthetase TilS [Pseudomonadota bacterium]